MSQADKELKLRFTDLVHLVRKEYSNEKDNISYAQAAAAIDKAFAPYQHQLLAEIMEQQSVHLKGSPTKHKRVIAVPIEIIQNKQESLKNE